MLLKKDPAEMGMLPDGAKATAEVHEKNHFHAPSVTLAQALRTRNF
jgi:hypothetical protein